MLGTENMLIDSTVFIQFFRNDVRARKYLMELSGEIKTSRIVVMEIVAGLKSKDKILKMWKQIDSLGVDVVEIDEEISRQAGDLFEKYYPTEGLGLMDAFIAATALKFGEKLVTHNIKHFKFIKGLDLIVPY